MANGFPKWLANREKNTNIIINLKTYMKESTDRCQL